MKFELEMSVISVLSVSHHFDESIGFHALDAEVKVAIVAPPALITGCIVVIYSGETPRCVL